MAVQQQTAASIFDICFRAGRAALAVLAAFAIFAIAPAAQAQTLSILHNFIGTGDGGSPMAGLTADRGGNFYGTTSSGGNSFGTVFKLTRAGSGWVLSTLYEFQGGSDGAYPLAGVVFGPDGALYGTTSDYDTNDSSDDGYGTVFRLTPPSHPCESVSCPWTETVLYRFNGPPDGAFPGYGNLAFDAAGNIYGTTMSGGGGPMCPYNNCGAVYKLTRSGESWTESVIYRFDGTSGEAPEAGVVLDSAGNLYGTAYLGGTTGVCGVAYELTQSGSLWTETVLHNFGDTGDGCEPFGGLIMDQQGNLYGTTIFGPSNNEGGTVYELQPSGGEWSYSILVVIPEGEIGPEGDLAMDAAGNLYGTVYGPDGYVFKVTPSGGSWTYTTLHSFDGHDGSEPVCSVALDAQGNLYGTTSTSTSFRFGEIWELTP